MLQTYQNILVPVDGSYEAELAFKKAVNVAKRNGEKSSIHLVHVVDTRAFQNISSFDTAMVEEVTDTAKKTIEGYIEDAKNKASKTLIILSSMVHRKLLSLKISRRKKIST